MGDDDSDDTKVVVKGIIVVFSTSVFSLSYLNKIILTSNFFWPNWYFQILAYTHAKFERLEHLLKGRARCLKAAT